MSFFTQKPAQIICDRVKRGLVVYKNMFVLSSGLGAGVVACMEGPTIIEKTPLDIEFPINIAVQLTLASAFGGYWNVLFRYIFTFFI